MKSRIGKIIEWHLAIGESSKDKLPTTLKEIPKEGLNQIEQAQTAELLPT